MPHDEYPTDLKIDTSRNVFLDATGDLATVTGDRGLEQSVAIHIGNATKRLIGASLTRTNLGLLEEEIREALNNDPQIEEIISVTVSEFDRRDNTVTVEATSVENHNYSFEVDA